MALTVQWSLFRRNHTFGCGFFAFKRLVRMTYGTGLSGFIGSNLLKKLPEDTFHISHESLRTTSLKAYDYFYFLSSYGNRFDQPSEYDTYRANIEDLLYVIKKSKGIKFKSFVYLSSSSVQLRKQTTYSRAKRAAEEILLAHLEKNDFPICIIRPFSVTGVGEQKEHLIPVLIDAAFTGRQINLVPHATHDFIDVDDVTDGILSLSKHGARGIFQLGTGVKYSNLDVLKLVEKVTGKKIKFTIIDSMRPYDNEDWVSTNFKARGWGWSPRKSLEQSIQEMAGAYAFKQVGA